MTNSKKNIIGMSIIIVLLIVGIALRWEMITEQVSLIIEAWSGNK